jgi:hypothetical protein
VGFAVGRALTVGPIAAQSDGGFASLLPGYGALCGPRWQSDSGFAQGLGRNHSVDIAACVVELRHALFPYSMLAKIRL